MPLRAERSLYLPIVINFSNSYNRDKSVVGWNRDDASLIPAPKTESWGVILDESRASITIISKPEAEGRLTTDNRAIHSGNVSA